VDGIIVPKLEADREVQDVREAMTAAGLGEGILCGGIESVAGVHRAIEVCGAGVDFVYFGAEDFITDIGDDEVEWARGLLAVAEAAEADGRGVVAFEGTMVDAPIILRARAVLAQVDGEN